MNIELVTRDVIINDEVQGRVRQKLEKILDRSNKETSVRLLVENMRGRFSAQISMHVLGKKIIAQSQQKNMLAAIDEAVDKADRQFKKHYERISAKR